MAIVCALKNRLVSPPIQGRAVAVLALVSVMLPTVIRWLVDDTVSGIVFSPYVPFVLLAAVVLEWRYAAVVALSSAAVADFLFMEPRFQPPAGASDAFGIAVFLATSAMVILLAQAAKAIVQRLSVPVASDQFPTGVIFSLERGQAWASWTGSKSRLRLGPEEEVAEMMHDFLAQLELGKRLGARHARSRERLVSTRSSQ